MSLSLNQTIGHLKMMMARVKDSVFPQYSDGQSGYAARDMPNDNACCHRTQVQQHQFDDTAHTGTANAAEKDHEHDEHSTQDGSPHRRHAEQAPNHRRRREHLGHDADKNADEKEDDETFAKSAEQILGYQIDESIRYNSVKVEQLVEAKFKELENNPSFS